MARRIIPAAAYPVAYEQNMATGQNWNKLSPTNEDDTVHADKGVYAPGLFAVPVDSVNNRGGLFTPGHPFTCKVTQIDMAIPAGTASWTLKRVRNGVSHIFLAGATVGDLFWEEGADELPTLLPGDTVTLESTGVTTAVSKCTIYFQSKVGR